MIFKPVSVLTSKYLRKVGLTQSVYIGTGHKHTCGSGSGTKRPCGDKSKGDGTGDKASIPEEIRKRPIHGGKVRLGFIPEEWFSFFYDKTGVTGPYMFGIGLLNYLLSKEIYVCEHEFYSGMAMAAICIMAVKQLGPGVADYCDDEVEKVEKSWKKMHKDEIKALQVLIDDEQKEQWRADGSLMLIQVKKENIALQLEAAYREALMNIYFEVRQKLQYQVACKNVESRINHKHMVMWVTNEVQKNLPKADEETMKKQRADLSALALRIKSSDP